MGAQKGGRPKISRFFFFFSSSCLKLHSLCSLWASSHGISVEFLKAGFNARAQERILTMTVAVDARVSGLEAVYVQVALLACWRVPILVAVRPQTTAFPETFPEECWAVVDDVNVRDFFDLW